MSSSYLTRAQVDQILKPINPSRVSVRDGMSHVEAYETRAHMARIFGVCRWSSEVTTQDLLFEEQVSTKAGKPAWYVGYRSIVRVTVCAPDGTQLAVYSEGHAGDSTHPQRGEAHGNAITNSESYAFKRCVCMAMLDQGGLSLYRKGSRDALVKRTLVMPDGDDTLTEDVAHDQPQVTPEAGEEVQAQASAQVTSPDTSAVPGPAESTPPAAPPTAPPDDEVAQQEAQAQIAKLREAALAFAAPDFAGTRQDAIVGLGRINLQAGKQRLLQQPVRKENGEEVTVGVFLDDLLKRVSRSAA